MSFLHSAFQLTSNLSPGHGKYDPLLKWGTSATRTPDIPPPPGPPNPNDAANAAREQTDAMRMRRGLLGSIYGGASGAQPSSGKTQLGT